MRREGGLMSTYGELVLVLGDAHIPYRAGEIHPKFARMLVPDKMSHVVSVGNNCSAETLEFLKTLAPNVHAVRGDMDDAALAAALPEETTFEVGDFRIGVIHGHQVVPWGDQEALGVVARRLDVDVLISGHTHVNETVEWNGRWFINPGSATGAYNPLARDAVKPSFICMSVTNDTITNYVYELSAAGEVVVQKTKLTKQSGAGPTASGGGGKAPLKDSQLFGSSFSGVQVGGGGGGVRSSPAPPAPVSPAAVVASSGSGSTPAPAPAAAPVPTPTTPVVAAAAAGAAPAGDDGASAGEAPPASASSSAEQPATTDLSDGDRAAAELAAELETIDLNKDDAV